MLVIEIFRTQAGLNISKFCEAAHIHKQTYYDILSGERNVSDLIINRISKGFNMPYLKGLLYLDRLYQADIKITDVEFPDSIPMEVQNMVRRHHPVFLSKLNSANIVNPEDINDTN